jgi:hypothetical protein
MQKILNLFDRLQAILIEAVDFQLTHLPCACALFCWCDKAGGPCVREDLAWSFGAQATENC